MISTNFWFWFIPSLIIIFLIIRNDIKKTNKMIEEHGIKDYEFVRWKGKMYAKGRVVGDNVQLLDFVSTRGLKSFFVHKDELGK